MNQSEEKRDAFKRANEFVIYRVWVESMDTGKTMLYKTVSGYGVSMDEAQANAEKRFRQFVGTKAKGQFFGGGYEILHGKKWR